MHRRRIFCCIFVFSISNFLIFICFNEYVSIGDVGQTSINKNYFGGNASMRNYLTILVWRDRKYSMEGRQMFRRCPKEMCILSEDKNLANRADAILFIIPLLGRNPDLPRKVKKKQKWIYFNLEAPTADMYIRGDKRFSKFGNRFDWTMNFRRDSDIVTPYMTIQKSDRNKSNDLTDSIMSKIKKKTKLVAWFASNFDITPSGRMDVVEDLRKHGIEVDIYGSHGPHKCPIEDGETCLNMLDEKYKFYLSFENSVCKDYITEKFYKVLPYDVVPIVYGGGDYRSVAPASSFIDVTTYDSIKDVAEYIKKLDKDDKLYAKYFEWKRNFVIDVEHFSETMYCQICHKLTTDPPSSVKSHNDLLVWWVKNSCLYGKDQLNRTIINETFNY